MKQRFFLTSGLFFLFACGSEEETPKVNRELLQDVKLIQYQLQKASVSLIATYPSGKTQEILATIDYHGESQDQVKKVIENERFVLILNEKKSVIDLAPDGKMKYKEEIQNDNEGCKLEGSSLLSGTADHKKLDLTWAFEVKMEGDGCTEYMTTKYHGFRNAEVEKLNLKAVSSLFLSLDQQLEQSRQVKIILRMQGEVR